MGRLTHEQTTGRQETPKDERGTTATNQAVTVIAAKKGGMTAETTEGIAIDETIAEIIEKRRGNHLQGATDHRVAALRKRGEPTRIPEKHLRRCMTKLRA